LATRVRNREAEATDRLIYALSHDLQAPLLNLSGFLKRLQQGCASLRAEAGRWPLSPDQRESCRYLLEDRLLRSAEILDQNTQKMQRRIQALLELSRVGREPVQQSRVPADALVEALGDEFRATAEARGARIEAGSLPAAIPADADRLRLVLRLLVENALKFLSSARPGYIRIEGRAGDGETILWVRDNGIGIRNEDFDRLFLPFGRLREIEAPGEGMGLACVRKLVEQQGGRVWLESTHGTGSTFYVALPAPETSTVES
jgi:signal transduction histidine kinase